METRCLPLSAQGEFRPDGKTAVITELLCGTRYLRHIRPQLSSVARSCSARANHFQGLRGVPIFGVKRERFA